MKLSAGQSRTFSEMLARFRRAGCAQSELANATNGVNESDLSNAKKGMPIGDAKWRKTLDGIERFLEEHLSKLAQEDVWFIRDGLQTLRASDDQMPMTKDLAPITKELLVDRELELAYHALKMNLEIAPSMWQIWDWKQLRAARTQMEGIKDGLLPFQNKLSEEVVTQLSTGRGPELAYNPRQDTRDFDRIINWERAQSCAMLCLFPFYLTAPRRLAWGVIKYAQQVRIGIALPRHIINLIRPSNEQVLTAKECRRIFQDPAPGVRQNIRLFYVHGYAMHEIVCNMVMNYVDERALNIFNEAIQPPLLGIENVVGAFDDLDGVLIFDLGIRDRVKDAMQNSECGGSYQVLELQHGVDVPVGIGFSLRALPWVVCRERPSALKHAALGALQDYQAELAGIGVELDNPS